MTRWLYQCVLCGAQVVAPWWEAMQLPEAEDRCPKCRQWGKFRLVRPALLFGKKAA